MPRNLIICLLLVTATVTIYGQTLHFDFVNYDDPKFILDNPQVRRGITVEGMVEAFTKIPDYWRPLSMISHTLDCQLYGLHAAGHHLTSVLLHLMNTLLLFGLLQDMTRRPWPSALVAALFALHPLHVESVAWIAERKDVLSTSFALVTIWAYVDYTRHLAIVRYLLVVTLFSFALMTKPMAVTLPLVLLLLDYWPIQRMCLTRNVSSRTTKHPFTALMLEKVPLLVLSAACGFATVVAQGKMGAVTTTEAVSTPLRLANAVVSYVRYIAKTIWPADLAVLYPHPNLAGGTPWTGLQILGAAALLVLISALVLLMHRRRYLVVGWLWFLGTLVPVNGLVQVGAQAMADRYTYVPLIGLFIMFAWSGVDLIAAAPARSVVIRRVVAPAAIIMLSACTFWAWRQTGYWKDTISLFERSISAAPGAALPHHGLGVVLRKEGEFNEAVEQFRTALDIAPTYMEAHTSWGLTMIAQENLEEAIDQFEQALALDDNSATAHNNMGQALSLTGKVEDAIVHFRRAIEIDPRHVKAHRNLGTILMAQDRHQDAVRLFRRSVQIAPDKAESYHGLASALMRTGRLDEAMIHYREAASLEPDTPGLLNNVAWILATNPQIRQGPDAIRIAKRAAGLTEHIDATILDTLAAAYAAAAQFPQAIRTAERAFNQAVDSKDQKLAEEIRLRLELYRQGKAYTQPLKNQDHVEP